MQAHILEPPQARTRPTGRVAYDTVVTPVGTFAEGQSAHGSFRVVAEAEVGSFASGLPDDRPSETETETETA